MDDKRVVIIIALLPINSRVLQYILCYFHTFILNLLTEEDEVKQIWAEKAERRKAASARARLAKITVNISHPPLTHLMVC